MSEWQPIETAPEDEWILVTDKNVGRIDMVRWVRISNGEGYNWITLDGVWHPNAALEYWMPLPEPPK